MNNRIKELVTECYSPYTNFDYEKFANLIVEDMLAIMDDPKNYNRCVHTTFDLDRSKCVVAELANKIKQLYKD